MNARIQGLRRESLETVASIDMERAKYFTEAYKEYEGFHGNILFLSQIIL